MKKFLYEFDNVKTPEGWAEEIIIKAENMTSSEKRKLAIFNKKKISLKLVVIIAALFVLSSTSIFAAYKLNAKYKNENTAQSLNHFDTGVDADGNAYTYDGGQKIDQTLAVDNLDVTCAKMSADSHSAYIQFSVSTKDGSSLVENSDTKVSIAARQKFENINVKIDGVEILPRAVDSYYHIQRVDDASQPDKAELELYIETEKIDLTGKSISVSLENYQDEWYEYQDIGFRYSSIAELAMQGTLASEDEFLPSDKIKYSFDAGMRLLNAGTKKIYFSDKYPEAYIDNMGFAPRDLSDKDKCFYITIVPGSEENTKALQKLVFQNMTTGMPNTQKLMSQKSDGQKWVMSEETLPDGRIEIALDVSADDMYNPGGRGNIDTTMENISNYTLIYNKSYEVETKNIRYTGKWAFDFNVNANKMDTEISKDVDSKVTETKTNLHTITVNHVDLTSLQLKINATILNMDTWEFESFPVAGEISSPYIIMKDGTRISAGIKVEGGYQKGEKTVAYGWMLPSLVDTTKVEAIEWYGVRIYLQ